MVTKRKPAGTWHEVDGHLFRVAVVRGGFTATVYVERSSTGRTVLGTYHTPDDALVAARDMLAMRGEERISTPGDIEAVRKGLATDGRWVPGVRPYPPDWLVAWKARQASKRR